MEETTYLESPGASVTSTRITIGNQTFATRNVGSVAVAEVPKPKWPILIGLVGAAMATGALSGGFSATTVMGLAMVAGAAAVLFAPAKLRLKLNAGGGEIMALETTDRAVIDALHQAIVKAIAAR
jgi:uncharacterized membrane protein